MDIMTMPPGPVRALPLLTTNAGHGGHNGNGGCRSSVLPDERARFRKTLSKRLITRIKHLRNEKEAEFFIEENLKLSREEEQMTQEVVNTIHKLFFENYLGGVKVNPRLFRYDFRYDIRL